MSQPDDLTTLAAVVSRQSLDLNLYASFLLTTLSGALPPEYVVVERKGSLFSRKPQPVLAVSVRLGDERFILRRSSPTATPTSSIAHEVGGIVLKSETTPLATWSNRLVAALAQLANSNADAAVALARMTSYTV